MWQQHCLKIKTQTISGMTEQQPEHLRLLDAHLTALLDLAAKRTPGRWEDGNDAIWSDCNGEGNSPTEICYQISLHDAAFIAACAGRAEAGWRSTRNTIKWALFMHKNGQVGEGLLESILAEWPIESLT
jgi:hypothetical protein